jgi:ARG/rhodanese/phosphatase superfamily protein
MPDVRALLDLGQPMSHRGVTIAPLFPRVDPVAHYRTLDEALGGGLRIVEVDGSGSVPELAVLNETGGAVLLYDGEELLGAKQNRILNVSVLVAPASRLRIPVSCVEQGRWRSVSSDFGAAPHASHPELRRRKAERLREQPLERAAAQMEVWVEVEAKSQRLGVDSPTGAAADMFEAREGDLAALRERFPLSPGQCGALLALAGRPTCLDAVSRPEAFARLYPKLLAGYLLDAIETLDGPAAGDAVLGAFLEAVATARPRRGRSVGLGDDLRLEGHGVIGSGLALGPELIQLSAYARDGEEPARATAIAAPARRSRAHRAR